MSSEIIGIGLLTGIFVGFPIAFTLIILSIVFGYIGFGDTVFYLMVFQTIGLMKEETLAAVPLFVFMGHILQQAGLMERLFRPFQLILAPLRGSLYLGVLLTSTIFATATGIIGVSVTVMGMMAAPAMPGKAATGDRQHEGTERPHLAGFRAPAMTFSTVNHPGAMPGREPLDQIAADSRRDTRTACRAAARPSRGGVPEAPRTPASACSASPRRSEPPERSARASSSRSARRCVSGAELVGDAVRDPAHGFHQRLGMTEHCIQRLGQAVEIVARTGQRDAARKVARHHLLGRPPHAFDPAPDGARHQEGAEQPGQQRHAGAPADRLSEQLLVLVQILGAAAEEEPAAVR